MRGLELSKRLYEAISDELFAGDLAYLRERAAIGLVGEGSECFGFDDEASRDHDWGPSLCIWLDDDDYREAGGALQARYEALTAQPFEGFAPRPACPPGVPRRVGVRGIGEFYESLAHTRTVPETIAEWRALPETGLAAATNGEVFADPLGRFSQVREALLGYYPEDIRLRKIASGCMHAAQAGQYNFPRQAMRGEELAAFGALARFCDAAMQVCYALVRRYLIFYKWAPRGLRTLGEFGASAAEGLEACVSEYRAGNLRGCQERIEGVCVAIVGRLNAEGLSDTDDAFLIAQGIEVNARIEDAAYRATDLMSV